MGVVSRRWVWVESVNVASGCGCKEVYQHPYFFVNFFKVFSFFIIIHIS